MIRVSVIVPVYNVEQYIRNCINSILRQTYVDFELILIDDGSTDQSGKICDEYTDRRVKVIHKKNEGAGEARNRGMDIAVGEYITFVDSDDYIAPCYLEKLLTIAEKNECDIVQCGFVFGNERKYDFGREKKKEAEVLFYDNHSVFDDRKIKIIMCAKLFRRSLFQELRYPKVSVHDDEFMTYKLLYQAEKVARIDVPYYYYYNSANSIMRTKKRRYEDNFVRAYDERIDFFKGRGEEELMLISYREKCIRIMLFYFQCSADKENENNKKELIKLFREDYKIARRRKMNFRDGFSLAVFYRLPEAVAKCICIFRKIKG